MATDTNVATSWHTVVSTALGELTLVRDADALRGLYFPHHWHLPSPVTFGPRCDDGFAEAVGQLGEYLAGQRHEFDLALAPRGRDFQQRVWNLVGQVPYGDTVTYGALACRLGRDVTAQQVGAAVGRNPLCIFLPCHRVVGAGSKLTGYAGGLARKRYLLDLEQPVQPILVLPSVITGSSVRGARVPGRVVAPR
jgi:methylated-DNA-[protein]-cysteine S-methyltransferase